MAIDVRKGSAAVQAALVSQHNALLKAVAGSLTTEPHADVTSTTSGDFSAPAATAMLLPTSTVDSLPKVIVRANLLLTYMQKHFADDLAHKAVDAVNGGTAGALLDVATVLPLATTAIQSAVDTRLNLIQDAYQAHLGQTGVHYTTDSTNTDSTTDAVDLSTSETMATNLTTAFNAHIQTAIAASAVRLIEA